MSSEVRVPALPESVADATVATWHKRPGDPVRREENLVDLETDKVVLEVPSPIDGILGEIMANEGDVVESDAVLALIEASAAETTPPAREASPPAKAAPAKAASPSPAAKGAPAGTEPQVAPAARRLVKELNLDPHAIPGTGRDGRIHKADVIPESRVSLVIPRGGILLPRGLGPWRRPFVPGFALRSQPCPTPRWFAGHDSALKWLDGVWDALCMLPPRLRDSRPFATAATRSRPRLPGTTRLRPTGRPSLT
jgi:hypothetical protein